MTAAERQLKVQTDRQKDQETDEPAIAAEGRPKLERTLVFVVVLLGILIVAGLVAVIGRVIYLSSHGRTQPSPDAASTTAPAPMHPAAAPALKNVQLPKGAEIKSIALDGGRLAIHYASGEGAGILIVDPATGLTLEHLRVAP